MVKAIGKAERKGKRHEHRKRQANDWAKKHQYERSNFISNFATIRRAYSDGSA